jgi:hypothetical protein
VTRAGGVGQGAPQPCGVETIQNSRSQEPTAFTHATTLPASQGTPWMLPVPWPGAR